MDGRYSAPPFVGTPHAAWVSPEARVEEGVELHGPCFVDEGVVLKTGTRVMPYSVLGRQTHVDEGALIDGADHLAQRLDRPGGRRARNDSGPQLPHRTQRRAGKPVGAGRQDSHHGLQPAMTTINTSIFKAYDVRGLYPSEVNEDAARADRPRLRQLPRREAHRRVARHAPVVPVGCRGLHRWRARAGRRRRGLRDDGHGHDVLRRRARSVTTAARRSPRPTIRRSTTASRWCGARRFRSAARRASTTSAT